jgi:hypothetical protein
MASGFRRASKKRADIALSMTDDEIQEAHGLAH